jgi:hypothetical protein
MEHLEVSRRGGQNCFTRHGVDHYKMMNRRSRKALLKKYKTKAERSAHFREVAMVRWGKEAVDKSV